MDVLGQRGTKVPDPEQLPGACHLRHPYTRLPCHPQKEGYEVVTA